MFGWGGDACCAYAVFIATKAVLRRLAAEALSLWLWIEVDSSFDSSFEGSWKGDYTSAPETREGVVRWLKRSGIFR